MWKRLASGGAVLLTLCSTFGAAAEGQSNLLVVNQGDRTVSVISSTSRKIIATVPVGGVTGHEVAVSPDGGSAFVPIYGDSGVGKPGTDGSTLAVIDLAARKLRGAVDFGHGVRPHCPVFDAARGLLYVTTELDQSVSVVDPRSLKVVGSIPTGQAESHMLALSHDGRLGYTANVGPGTVSVLDLQARQKLAVIPVAGQVQRISISVDDRFVFTADQTQPRMAVIDTASRTVSRWIALPGIGYGATPTKDGRYLLVTLREAGKLAVVDLQTFTAIRTLDVGHGPVEVLLEPGGHTAYISCPLDAAVAELSMTGDVSGWKVVRTIPAGVGADGLAWAGK